MITVRDLLDAPELRFSLAAGSDEALERVVVAAHVSELTNPSPWLQGGELLMTAGLVLPKALDGYREYLQDCRRGGVSGVVLGLGADLPFQRAPADLIVAADEVGLPLLVLPDPIPFIAVTKWVFARLAAEERQEWQDAVAITRELTRAAASSTPMESLLKAWSTALGTAVLVTDLNGVPLSSCGDGVDDLLAQSHDLVRRTVGEGVRSLSTSGLDGEHGVEVLTLGSSHARGLAILERSSDARARHAITVFVSLLSLEVDHRHASDNPERLRRAQVVAKLLRPGLRADQGPRLAASIGLDVAALRVVVVRTHEGEQAEELAATLTAALSAAAARPRISAVELLLPDAEGLVAVFDRLAGGRPVGIGGVGRPGDLAVSRPAGPLPGRAQRAPRTAGAGRGGRHGSGSCFSSGRRRCSPPSATRCSPRSTSSRPGSGSSCCTHSRSGCGSTAHGRRPPSDSRCTATPFATGSPGCRRSRAGRWRAPSTGSSCGSHCRRGPPPSTCRPPRSPRPPAELRRRCWSSRT